MRRLWASARASCNSSYNWARWVACRVMRRRRAGHRCKTTCVLN